MQITAEELLYSLIDAFSEKKPDEWETRLVAAQSLEISGFEFASGKFSLQRELMAVLKKRKGTAVISTGIDISVNNGFLKELVHFFNTENSVQIKINPENNI